MTATQKHPDPSDQNTPMSLRGRPVGQPRVPRSRIGGVWVALVAATIVLLFLLIFVLQNSQRVELSFLGFDGTLPMGVALLLAAVFGVLLVALPGTARIMQLRMASGRGGTGRGGTGRGGTGRGGPVEDRLQAMPHTVGPSASDRPAGHRAEPTE